MGPDCHVSFANVRSRLHPAQLCESRASGKGDWGELCSTYVLFTASNTTCPTSLTLDGANWATRSWHFFLAAASRASIAATGTGWTVVRGMDWSSCNTSTRWIFDARTILKPASAPLLDNTRGDVSHTAEAAARRMDGASALVCPVSCLLYTSPSPRD